MEIVKKISDELNQPQAKIYTALHRLRLIERKTFPKAHWETTELGRKTLDTSPYEIIREVVDLQLKDIEQGPRLQRKDVPARKICRKCNIERTITCFGLSDRTTDGLTKWCLPCLFQFNQEQHHG